MHKTQNNNIYGIIFNYTFDYKRKNTKEVWFDFICSLRCNLIACTWFMLKLLNYDQSRKLSIVYFLPTDFFQLKYIFFLWKFEKTLYTCKPVHYRREFLQLQLVFHLHSIEKLQICKSSFNFNRKNVIRKIDTNCTNNCGLFFLLNGHSLYNVALFIESWKKIRHEIKREKVFQIQEASQVCIEGTHFPEKFVHFTFEK